MQISKGFEQAVYVLMILEIKGKEQTIKSGYLSKELQVSDSSLKKLLHKLVAAGLTESVASKDGGFRLAKPVEKITLLDIMKAVDGPKLIKFKNTHLASQIFPADDQHIKKSEDLISQALNQAESAYEQSLVNFTLDKLLEKNQESI